MHPYQTVDQYIAFCPEDMRPKLELLRAAIKEAAPTAVEKISYGMPYYHYKGRLIYFQLHTKHIGIYLPTPVVEEHQKELAAYEANKATVRFPLDAELPIALIKKLVKARMKKNDELEREKNSHHNH